MKPYEQHVRDAEIAVTNHLKAAIEQTSALVGWLHAARSPHADIADEALTKLEYLQRLENAVEVPVEQPSKGDVRFSLPDEWSVPAVQVDPPAISTVDTRRWSGPLRWVDADSKSQGKHGGFV